MRELFIRLLNEANKYGWITEANMFKCGTFSTFMVETDNGNFTVSISKEDEVKEDA